MDAPETVAAADGAAGTLAAAPPGPLPQAPPLFQGGSPPMQLGQSPPGDMDWLDLQAGGLISPLGSPTAAAGAGAGGAALAEQPAAGGHAVEAAPMQQLAADAGAEQQAANAMHVGTSGQAAPIGATAAAAPADAAQQSAPAAAPAGAAVPPSAAALAAAPQPPQPLHFVDYRCDEYNQAGVAACLRRWLLLDSQGRWHVAVDTSRWDANKKQYSYTSVEPFTTVRPLQCTNRKDVERYLDAFIPPHRRRQPLVLSGVAVSGGAAAAAAAAGAAERPATSSNLGGAAAGARAVPPMQQYAAGLLPAGAKRPRGRPRIHPPKEPKQPRQPKVPAGDTPAGIAGGIPSAAHMFGTPGGVVPAAAAGVATLGAAVAAAAGGATPGSEQAALTPAGDGEAGATAVKPKRKGPRPLAEAVFIDSEERRQQVYELRIEAVLAELALLKAQCGIDYSLTLVSPARQVEVMTSATANVQASKVVRAKRSVEKPQAELEPAAPDASEAADAVAELAAREQQEQSQAVVALADAALAGRRGGGSSLTMALPALPIPLPALPAGDPAAVMQFVALQQQQIGAVAMQQPQQEARPLAAAAAGAGTTGKKRRGRPPKHARVEEEPEYEPPGAKRIKAERAASLPPQMPESLDPDVRHMLQALQKNEEAYMQGAWRRQPYDEIELEEIESFVVAEDCGEERDAAVLPTKLRTNLTPEAAAAAGSAGGSGAGSEELMVLAELPQGLAAGEVDVRSVWGIDRFTRKSLWEALGRCPQLGSRLSAQLDAARTRFLEQQLLPALNRQGEEGWDLVRALQQLATRGDAGSDANATSAAAMLLIRVVQGVETFHNRGQPRPADEREWFRAHPKGDGVVLLRDGGLPAGAFIGEYLGELYAAWRWLERDNRTRGRGPISSNRRMFLRLGTTDEFYNITLERPANDTKGYDVLFVNAAARGNFTARMCHSCDPNCKTVPMVVGGRCTIGVWTTRPVAAGEELTLDWSCETENDREFRHATCLCGSAACRGSFLYISKQDTSGPLQQYAAAHHTFLDRCRLLLTVAAEQQPGEEDVARLARHGFGESLLTDGVAGQGGVPLPAWLRRWAAAVLEFIEAEAKALPALMLRKWRGRKARSGSSDVVDLAGEEEGEEGEGEHSGRDEEQVAQAAAAAVGGSVTPAAQEASEVAAEVEHQRKSRVQALAIALDKAKLLLRHQEGGGSRAPPLRLLSEREAVEFLWTDDDSVARRAVASLAAFTERQVADSLIQGRKPRNAAPPSWLAGTVDAETFEPVEPVARRGPRLGIVGRRQAGSTMLGALSAAPSGSGLEGGGGATSSGGAALLQVALARSDSIGQADVQALSGMQQLRGSPRAVQQAQQAQQEDGEAEAAAPMEMEGGSGPAGEQQQQQQQLQQQGQGSPPAAAEQQQAQQPEETREDGEEQQPQPQPQPAGADEEEQDEEGQEFETLAEQLESMLEEEVVTTLQDAQAGLRKLAGVLRAAGIGHAGLHDLLLMYASVQRWVGMPEYKVFTAQLANGEEGGRYRSQHLWATLSSWWRAGTSADPMVALTNDRRGCLNLPEPECCYLPIFASGNYVRKGHRRTLLRHIAGSAKSPWPPSTPFTFKNLYKVYGSPQLDALLEGSDERLQQLLAELGAAF